MPGKTCRGDALGSRKTVYKVPNRSEFVCNRHGCRPQNIKSWSILRLAMIKNGADKYKYMSMKEFYRAMGRDCLDIKADDRTDKEKK